MSEHADIKSDVNRGLAWIGLASSLVWALDIIATLIILAFWVTPEQYGIAALAMSLFPVLDLVANMGLSAAVIQHDDHTEERICTVFWLNLAMTTTLFALLALVIGPALANLHGYDIIGLMLAAYGGRLLWINVYLIPLAMMRRELRFKELSGIRTFANFLEFVTKVGSAAAGLGIWCFVIGPSFRAVGYGLGAQYCHPWRPRLLFRFRDTVAWAVYGAKTIASQILFQLYTNVDDQVVGYSFGAEATGFYKLAKLIVMEPCRMISAVIIQIAFPVYSRLKNDRAALIEQLISFTKLNLIIMLALLGVVMVSIDDILMLWGDQFMPAAAPARMLCGVAVLLALSYIIPPLLDAMGRPGLTLTYTAVAAVVLPASFVSAAYFFSDYQEQSVALAWLLGYPIAFAVLFGLALTLLRLPLLGYVRQIWGVVACAAIAIGASAGTRWLAIPLPTALRLVLSMTALLSTFFMLLAYWQGIGPKSVRAALKGAD